MVCPVSVSKICYVVMGDENDNSSGDCYEL